ncbi:hypothetical protein [Peribacillus loiseleuriae]|uniref:hypothetical protein n=1 Tax=Peribacillus loiseleuriae TaxID=1679170 RepID=UPI003D0374FB
MENKKFYLIWEDIMYEHGGEETIEDLRKEYSNYSNEELISLLKALINFETEDKPFRFHTFITNSYIPKENETVVYCDEEIDYHNLLVSLLVLSFLINIEDRPSLIVKSAQTLYNFDREITDQIRVDIAEEVYREYR